jgi:hypothetical protein
MKKYHGLNLEELDASSGGFWRLFMEPENTLWSKLSFFLRENMSTNSLLFFGVIS